MALAMALSMSQPTVEKSENGIIIVTKQTAPYQESDFQYETIALELPPMEQAPAGEPSSVCEPLIEETEPEEGTIALEGEGVTCPPPCMPAPISEEELEEPELPEETIALELDPIVGPPVEEP